MIELMFTKQTNQKSVTFLYLYFSNKGFKFESYVCNRCYDLLMMFMNVRDIGFTKIKNVDYRCIITRISKVRLWNYCKILIWLKKIENYKLKKYIKISESIYKKRKNNIKFGDIEREKQKFHQHKKPVSIETIDINKVVVSNMASFYNKGFKCFIDYKNDT